MKLMYGDTPIKNLNIIKHDVSTNDATMSASDLQAGVTAYARGQKITGTGKCFEFADYGTIVVNFPIKIPTDINVIEISSTTYPIRTLFALRDMKNVDFSVVQELAKITIDNVEYSISVIVQDGIITLNCDRDLDLEIFYGKDRYI